MYEVKTEVIRSIIREFINELNKRDYEYSENALDKIINEWVTRKQDLLQLLSKHPLWNPDKLMIQFDQDYDRRIELRELANFCTWLLKQVTTWCGYKLLEDLNCTQEEDSRRQSIIIWMNDNIKKQFFDESMKEQIDKINAYNDNFKLRTNMKASKAIGKICREEGWDRLEGYNSKYAALCDNLNPIKVKRHTVISLNPIDFLLMSNGDSWESCHYIGDEAEGAGCYSSGTISYMLDECSFVFYTVNADFNGTDIELAAKSQREIFGYKDEVFIQSRLYPQANDCGAEAIYDDIRSIIQKIIADCLNKPNLWTITRNLSKINRIVKLGSGATCYPDWHGGCPGSQHVSVSTLKDKTDDFSNIVLGAKPICISCGSRHTYTENISCCKNYNGYYCTECGSYIYEDDVYWVGDYPYCDECSIYCDRCGEYEDKDNAMYIDGEWYCESCAEDVSSYCEGCGSYHLDEYGIFTEEGDFYCEDCIDNYAFKCTECGEWYNKENGYYDEITDSWYCEECYNELIEEREESEEVVNE